ncbi:EAL domain-containing protein [Marinobacter sp. 1Y8]
MADLSQRRPLAAIIIWLPLALVAALSVYVLVIHHTAISTSPAQLQNPLVPDVGAVRTQIEFQVLPLQTVLDDNLWQQGRDWRPKPAHSDSLGYLNQPTTFRVSLTNADRRTLDQLMLIPAPSLDQVRAVVIGPDGKMRRLATLGDSFPFAERTIELPNLIWPVTLPGNSETTVLFEVVNAGPTLFPFAMTDAESMLSTVGITIAWKSFLYGVLLFALAFCLSLLVMLRQVRLAWLAGLIMATLISQLSLDGFGLWLLWPGTPAVNSLLTPMHALSALCLLGFTRHYLGITGRLRGLITVGKIILLLLALASPLHLDWASQAKILLMGAATMLFVVGIAVSRRPWSAPARILTCFLVIQLLGAVPVILRTIGILPVNELTTSSFFISSAVASVYLTLMVAYSLMTERRRRRSADSQATRERELRAQLAQDYNQLLTNHRITRRPSRPIIEQTLDQLHVDRESYTIGILRLERYAELERTLGYREAEKLLRIYLSRFSRFLESSFPDQLVLFQGHCLGTIDTASHVFAFKASLKADLEKQDAPVNWQVIEHWLQRTFVEERYAFSWTPRIGIATAPDHGNRSSDLISRAGYATLSRHQNINRYNPQAAEQQDLQHFLLLDLDHSLRNGDIHMAYQPKISLHSGETTGYEALIRWRHPGYGDVAPSQWIPFAEQVGAIHQVTLWAIDRAAQDLAELQAATADDVTVAVNISVQDLASADFHLEAADCARRHQVDPARMVLEITETAVMADKQMARVMLDKLRGHGFRIALDDFGTGHSSLGALVNFNVDELKIDRSFLTDIGQDAVRQSIFRAAFALGTALNLRIVVEGVETGEVADWLKQFPGLYGQGFYWGRPEPLATR